jgi:hypothetical protein
MKLEDLYRFSKSVQPLIEGKTHIDVIIYLNKSKHENLQQNVFKLKNNTLYDYRSKDIFEIIISNVKYTFKVK